jgi:hypothetical protein
VERMVSLIHQNGYDVATYDEAREMQKTANGK